MRTHDAPRRLAVALLAAIAVGGFAGGAAAEEKTFGRGDASQAVAQVRSQDVVRGEHNTRLGRYGEAGGQRMPQVAAIGETVVSSPRSPATGGYNVTPGR